MSQSNALNQAYTLQNEGRFSESAKLCKQHLSQFPRDVEAIRLYALLAEKMGKSAEAIVIYRKLLQLLPGDVPTLNALAWSYYHTYDLNLARGFGEEALAKDPNSAGSVWLLGTISLAEGDEERGRALLEKAKSLGADERSVDDTFFQHLISEGRFDVASKLARELVSRWPNSSSAYANLAQTIHSKADISDAETILSMLDENGELGDVFRESEHEHVEACEAVYTAYSCLKNYDRAWGFLEQMKEPLRTAVPLAKRLMDSDLLNLTTSVFTEEFVKERAAHATTDSSPIFIVGMPRSGTTLLERALATSPDVAPAGERTELTQVQEKLCGHFGSNQYDLKALGHVPLNIWHQAGEEYIRRVRSNTGDCSYFVDKMPGNFLNIGFIRSALPRAKIIHITRHPVANCFSIYERNFGVRHPYNLDLESLGSYYLSYADIMRHWLGMQGSNIIEVRYEDLVTNTHDAVRQLGEELGITLDPEALKKSYTDGAINTASYWQARQPVHGGSVARWERFADQLNPLRVALAPLLSES